MPELFPAPPLSLAKPRIVRAIMPIMPITPKRPMPVERAKPVCRVIAGALLAGVTTAGLWLAATAPAQAEEPYRWCAEYASNDGSGGVNCGFDTLAQCRATISGIGGTCYENPAYPAPRPKPKKRNTR